MGGAYGTNGAEEKCVLSVGPLLPFEDFTSTLQSPG
jgi:hypothetical protein